jgi:serine phosphatase RsbU (regulator of sigma subunit)/anti-sigma regulatory factor (Ser/Thr protein kinase)
MRTRSRQRRRAPAARPEASEPTPAAPASFDIAPDDPLIAYFQSSPDPVEIDKLRLVSPGVEALRAAGVKLAVPLVTQGELIGVLSLGSRLSEQDYSADDRKLLDTLASRAAPALRVAQLVREQEAEIRTRERYEQELRIAHLIQQNFLPREAPELRGWRLAAFYRSARHVGGDFYDFIDLADGRTGIVIGDVTDKGVPAALMMASTRSVIRSVAQRISAPGEVLEVVNEQLVPEMPPKMFVTCLYAVLEPDSGHLVYANAGHNVPYRKAGDCVDELKARGMPLGLMAGSKYEEMECTIGPSQVVLFSSDGISEAHDPDGEMFGCPRIIEIVERYSSDNDLRDAVLSELDAFTGPEWEQEDDITMVTLERAQHEAADFAQTDRPDLDSAISTEFTVPSEPGNERMAMERVASILDSLDIPVTKLDKLKTAVAEATMNAIEHGNENNPELLVTIEVVTSPDDVRIRITDFGGGKEIPQETAPDLDAKLRGEQTPRGWGLFLIKAMVDELNVTYDDVHHTVELVMRLD